jgi:hypothetical protein
MGNSPLGNPTFGGLYLVVYPNGIFNLLWNPDPQDYTSANVKTLKNGRIPNFNVDEMTRIELRVDRQNNTVDASANDQRIVDAVPLNDMPLDPAYAGVAGFWQPPRKRCVGSFSLRTNQ